MRGRRPIKRIDALTRTRAAFDLSPAGDLSALCVIEVNSNPMIQTLEDNGRWDLIVAIWRANFAAALK